MFSYLRPYIFSLDPESAHDLAIKSLKYNFIPQSFFDVKNEEMLSTSLFRKKLKNTLGLAAGFDKSAEVYNSLFQLGFGFVEVGTITPKRQSGNPKPRVFRLENDRAMINRLGFNNDGIETVSDRLKKNVPEEFLGINIGPNKDTKEKALQYIEETEVDEAFLNDYIKKQNVSKEEAIKDLKDQASKRVEEVFGEIGEKKIHGFMTGADFGLPMSIAMEESAMEPLSGNISVLSHERGHANLFRKLMFKHLN